MPITETPPARAYKRKRTELVSRLLSNKKSTKNLPPHLECVRDGFATNVVTVSRGGAPLVKVPVLDPSVPAPCQQNILPCQDEHVGFDRKADCNPKRA